MVVRSRNILVDLCTKVRLTTLAAANDFSAAAERQYLEVEVPGPSDLLPHAEGLTLIGLTEGVSAGTNFRWGLFGWSGYDRNNEVPTHPFPIGTTVTGPGSLRHAPHAILTDYLLASRLALGYGYVTGGAAVVSAVVSGKLLVKTVGM